MHAKHHLPGFSVLHQLNQRVCNNLNVRDSEKETQVVQLDKKQKRGTNLCGSGRAEDLTLALHPYFLLLMVAMRGFFCLFILPWPRPRWRRDEVPPPSFPTIGNKKAEDRL